MQYAALSYVWSQAGYLDGAGKPRCVEQNGHLYLPETVPQVVQDALHVVKQLGLRYLWVDSYCINQYDNEEKTRLIGKMDLVFEGASMTICAMSGINDPPGICGVTIPMQRTAQVVKHCTIGTFKTIKIHQFSRDISRSPWNKRAWTMEEALLSPRRLLFMKNQTALWCKSHVFHDTFSWSEVPANGPPAGSGVCPSPVLSISISEGPHWDFEAWSRILIEYTGRHLTQERDAMRALAGLRNRLSRNTRTQLPFGLPLSTSVCSLLWKCVNGATFTRREGFPSWSWLGWRGTVDFDHWLEPSPSEYDSTRCLLGIPRRSSSVWGLRKFDTDFVYLQTEARVLSHFGDDLGSTAHQSLLLECLAAHFQVQWIEDKNGWQLLDQAGNTIPVIKGYNITGSRLYLALPKVKDNFDPGHLEFLCIQHWKEAAPLSKKFGDVVTTIVVTRDKLGKATRIGSFAIPYKNWEAAKPQLIRVEIV